MQMVSYASHTCVAHYKKISDELQCHMMYYKKTFPLLGEKMFHLT